MPGRGVERSGPLTFTIQKHAARRLHYDLRLEMHDVLVSWPVPKGPSYDPEVRRLAIQTEDHAYEYGTFEGGEVIVWDAGTYTLVEEGRLPDFRDRARVERLAEQGVANGHLRVFFNGRKLKGGWTMIRTTGQGPRSQWLIMKRRDGFERAERALEQEDRSIYSGLRLEDLQAGEPLPELPFKSLRPSAWGVPGAREVPFPQPSEPMPATLPHVRAYVDDGRIHLRSGGCHGVEDQYPEIVRALSAQALDQAVFDGKIVARRLSIFDLRYLDGFDLRGVRRTNRMELLHAVLAPVGGLECGGVDRRAASE